jgi:hypothetical protein
MSTTTINTAPTAAGLLIDALSPKHRSILFVALQCYMQETIISLDAHLNSNDMAPTLAGRITEFHRWNLKELKEIKNVLFADSFHDDLEPIKYFQKDLPPMQKPKPSIQ